jgi:hypothetical protein
MRIPVVLIAASILGTACAHESRYDRDRYGAARPQAFEAYTTDGESVLVDQDPRTGELYIVQPEQFRGERVALVNRDAGGRALVTREVSRRRYEGSAGDVRREDDRRDHRDDDHRQ